MAKLFNPTFRASSITAPQLQNPLEGLNDLGQTLIKIDAANKEQKRQAELDAWNKQVRNRQVQEWDLQDKTRAATDIANRILSGPSQMTVGELDITKLPGFRGYEAGMTPEQEAVIAAEHKKLGEDLLSNEGLRETELDKIERAKEAILREGYQIPDALNKEFREARGIYETKQAQKRKDKKSRITDIDDEIAKLKLSLGKSQYKAKKDAIGKGSGEMFTWVPDVPDLGSQDTKDFITRAKARQQFKDEFGNTVGYSNKQMKAAILGAIPYGASEWWNNINEEGFEEAFNANLAAMTPKPVGINYSNPEAAAIAAQIDQYDTDKLKLSKEIGQLGLSRDEQFKSIVGSMLPKEKVADIASNIGVDVDKALNAKVTGLKPVDGGFKANVLATETSNVNYKSHRKDKSGNTETLGAYQFVPSTLANLQKETGEKFTHEEFLNNPKLQDKYFELLTEKNRQQLVSNKLPVNDFNLWLMHNLGGGGQTKNFLSDEPLTESTKKAIALNLPKGVKPTRENYIARFGSRFGANTTKIPVVNKPVPTIEDIEEIKKLAKENKNTKVLTMAKQLENSMKTSGLGPISDSSKAQWDFLRKSFVEPVENYYDLYQEKVGQPFVEFINKYAPGGNR